MAVGVATMLSGLGISSLAAQITYSVFPAVTQSTDGLPIQPTGSSGPLVTLVVRDSTVKWAINTLARQAHLVAMYSASPSLGSRVMVKVDNIPVMDAMAVVLRGTGLVATRSPDGETVVIHPLRSSTSSEHGRLTGGIIAGHVIDSASGAGLSGVQVHVAGIKNLSVVTSDSGSFTLRDVPVGDQVLTARLFGYKPVDRTVAVIDSQRTIVRILMASVPTVLSGVVTTATGVQRKVEVGNDITTINVDSVMKVVPVNSLTDLLETRVPGLTVLHSSGDPGNPSRLRLRGIGSISGNNDPVVIVDGIRVYSSQSDTRNNNLAPSISGGATANNTGVTSYAAPSPIDQIDPNSIETIDVFKGPSASALYGSDAANGVIVITTKHGRTGPTHWSLDLAGGVNWIPGSWPLNYFRFGTNAHGVGPLCNWYDPTCVVVDSLRSYQALNDPRNTVLSHGTSQQTSLTISGGNPALQYSISGSLSGDLGNLKLPLSTQQLYESLYGPIPSWMVRPDRYTTSGVSGSLTAHPYHTLQVTFQSSLFNGNQQTSSLQTALTQLEGVYISGNTFVDYNGNLNSLATTPVVDNYVERATAASVNSMSAMTLGWQPKVWLPITVNGGIQTMERTDQTYVPYGINTSGSNVCGTDPACLADTTGSYGLGRGISHNQTVAAGTVIPLLHQHVSLAVGGNTYTETTNDFSAFTTQLAPGISSPSTFVTPGCNANCGLAQQSSSANSTYGWYTEPRLNLNSRFFAAPGFRFDGGSGGTHATTTGGTTGGLSAFPKLDLSYVAVDHQSRPPLWGFLTLLRPRVAFGLAGTQPAPQDRLRLFNSESYQLAPGGEPSLLNGSGCNNSPGICLSSLGNTQLRPERSSELEGGFDATLWNGRFTVTYTQYNKTRKDAIISIPIAPSVSGINGAAFNIAENIGEVRNTGTELTLNTTLLESRALSWNVGANLSNDNNLLVHLNPGQSPNYSLGLVPGYPLFGQWVYPILYFSDQNNDHIIEPNEIRIGSSRVFAGQPNPKYQLNLNTDVHLLNGRLGVFATFAYQNGMTQHNQAALNSHSFYLLGNDPSTPLAYEAAVNAATCASGGCSSGLQSTYYGLLQTVNTFRFNDLSINYELPKLVSAWLRVPRVMMALQGSNLGLHTNYRGKDPDVNAFATVSSVDETLDLGQVPEPRTWWLKFTLGN